MNIKRRILSLALVLMLQPIPAPASGQSPDALYLQQQSSNSCTLCSATMMIRSCLYNNDEDWGAVTEQAVAEMAWTEAGLSWHWNWSDGENTVRVVHQACSGLSAQELSDLLTDHPEGIVLYCGGSTHHGIFLSEYRDSVFYCADPAVGYAGERIKLEDSLLGSRLGTQDAILRGVTAYWYIEQYTRSPIVYTATVQTNLKI